jgi:hypothetical protein
MADNFPNVVLKVRAALEEVPMILVRTERHKKTARELAKQLRDYTFEIVEDGVVVRKAKP